MQSRAPIRSALADTVEPMPPGNDFRPDPGVIAELLTRAGRGDRQAFAAFYDAAVPAVFGIVRRIVVDRAISEEVTQEVMVTVWQQAPRFEPDRGSAMSWVLTIARRHAIDRVRSEQAHRDRHDRAPATAPAHDPVSETAVERSEHREVGSALAALTELQREAIDLTYYQGLSYAEAARTLGVPEATLKTRARDGLLRLRDSLGVTT